MGNSIILQLLPTSLGGIVLATVLLPVLYQLTTYAYNLFFHPLRKFPGPVTSAVSSIPYITAAFRGDGVFWVVKLHEKYGNVVRIAPNELSFSGNEAYKDIYGHKKAGLPTLQKDPHFYKNPSGERDIVNGTFEEHARMRRIFANAFSDRALRLQEPLFLTYVDKLVQNMHEAVARDEDHKFNMISMWNFTTFDIMGDLTFGESLGLLDNSSYHPWVQAMFSAFKFGVYVHSIRYLPLLDLWPKLEGLLLNFCIPRDVRDQMSLHGNFSEQRVNHRLEKQSARPDIWGLVLEKGGDKGLSKREMYSNANLFMIAGTETTATLLSGLTYYLLSNPSKLRKLVNEIRSTFASESDISIERLQALPYLNACLEEGLRMYPPVSNGLARITPPGAPIEIDGKEVPPNTKVYVTNLAAHRNSENYRDPYEFVPERWLSEKEAGDLAKIYAGDKKSGFSPFSTGPRACLGKNMAYHEMRLILTKVLFNFDLELCEESRAWNQHKIYIMWEKPPLYCRLAPVQKRH